MEDSTSFIIPHIYYKIHTLTKESREKVRNILTFLHFLRLFCLSGDTPTDFAMIEIDSFAGFSEPWV